MVPERAKAEAAAASQRLVLQLTQATNPELVYLPPAEEAVGVAKQATVSYPSGQMSRLEAFAVAGHAQGRRTGRRDCKRPLASVSALDKKELTVASRIGWTSRGAYDTR